MARNRKNQSSAVRFGPAIKALLLCVLLGGSGIGYVQQQDQLHLLAGQRKQREVKLNKLRRENEERLRVLDFLQTPAELEARVKQMNLGLGPAQPDQVVHLVDHGADVARPNDGQLYAERTSQ